MSDTPFFARFLDSTQMQQVVGGDPTGVPNSNASNTAFDRNPNAGPQLVTLKAGTCGNDCDHPGGGAITR